MLCRGGPLRHSKSVAVAESLVVDMVELAPGVPVLANPEKYPTSQPFLLLNF